MYLLGVRGEGSSCQQRSVVIVVREVGISPYKCNLIIPHKIIEVNPVPTGL